jgi:uncharacterized protein (TIGR02145 family)
MVGIIDWINDETARISWQEKSKGRPVSFEDDPDLDRSGILRKIEITVSYLKDNLIKGKWDITLLWNADVDHSSGNKYQTITFLPDNRYKLEGTDFIPGSSSEGSYELNTNEVPNWIDFYPDKGKSSKGLIQEHLHGYKLETNMDSELNSLMKRSKSKSGHPLEFTDVEFGVPSVINYNSNFLYLHPSNPVQKNAKGAETSGTTGNIAENQIAKTTEPVNGIKDIEGNTYKTIVLDNGQHWMAENLKYLPGVSGFGTGSLTMPYYYVHGYNGTNVADAKATANYQIYGVLYNWAAALKACPPGWHLPSDAEWNKLVDYWEGKSGIANKLKEVGTTHWVSPNTEATNETGFTALPGGSRRSYGFLENGTEGSWWTSDIYGQYGPADRPKDDAWYYSMSIYSGDIRRASGNKEIGFSVRCVKD